MRQVVRITDFRQNLKKYLSYLGSEEGGIIVVHHFLKPHDSFVAIGIDEYSKRDPSVLELKADFVDQLGKANSKKGSRKGKGNKVE